MVNEDSDKMFFNKENRHRVQSTGQMQKANVSNEFCKLADFNMSKYILPIFNLLCHIGVSSLAESKYDINCDFKEPFLCGYQTYATDTALTWKRDFPIDFNTIQKSSEKYFSLMLCIT